MLGLCSLHVSTLIYGTIEISEIHLHIKFKLERIDYMLIDYKVIYHQIFDCMYRKKAK